MNDMEPSVSSGRKLSAIWILPLVTLIVGVSIVINSIMTEGPTITIDFATADGLEVGKTKIRLLSVEVGVVEGIALKEDMSGVTATIKLERETQSLLRADTRFWVVRARVGAGGISGLGTILGGSYIEMAPGTGTEGTKAFVGLEEPPLTPLDAPGLRLSLFSQRAGSISTGDAVLYRGYKVGRVESLEFDTEQRRARYDIFIDAPFHELVDSTTRFWDTSGISVKASAEGLEIHTGSLDTILLGGVAFASPPDLPAGDPVENGKEFQLYKSYDSILKNPYRHGMYYVVSFRQSIRGLVTGAPVEYRGIKIGRVERILMKELAMQGMTAAGSAIPILIYVEPGRMALPDNLESISTFKQVVEKGIENGLRATLQTGNLLTGKQLISFDFFPDEEPAVLGHFGQYTLVPTVETGVGRLENQVRTFLDTLNALPLEAIVAEANTVLSDADKTVVSLTATLNSVNSLLDNNDSKALPGELVATLAEMRNALAGLTPESKIYQSLGASVNSLNSTLESMDALLRKLSIKPNTLLFPTAPEPDLIPEARPR
ncbi:MAG: intermembrane transport protein PqiB [Candidatus Lindowbacteria bacterium]|nr:intermembrane transport protein PqiB [Candidatus Lindowbacteria bacterium]